MNFEEFVSPQGTSRFGSAAGAGPPGLGRRQEPRCPLAEGAKDGELDATNPFQEDHLQVKDLIEDTWNMKGRNIGLRTGDAINAMRGLVKCKDDRWLRLVAIARFRSEAERPRPAASWPSQRLRTS